MKTILVLSLHPDFAEAIRAGLNADHYRVVHRLSVDDAEPLLVHGLAAVCIVDVDLMGIEGIWVIERLRRHDAKSPVIAYTAGIQSEWEEEAFLRGATHVLTKPVRARLLNSLLERLEAMPVRAAAPPPSNSFPRQPEFSQPHATNTAPMLDVLRDFSPILTYSLNAEAMLKQFLSFLRETFSINRAAIFLNRPCAPDKALAPNDNRRLRLAAASGLSAGLLENIELSLDAGIGGQIFRLGRILRRDSTEVRADAGAQKEFELLGGQVAVPIADRNGMVGVAVFDARITGEPLVNSELELVFHLLEQVGLALRNIWLYDQIASNNEMMSDVLRELSSACIVVGQDLKILHANKSARRHFGQKNQRTGDLEFSDLPHALGAKIYQVLKTGTALGPFRYEPENSSDTVYNVSVVPFQRGNATAPVSALLTAEDLTQTEQLQKLEIEAENLRLVKSMADRMAHEIGNTMVPLSTHQQLLAEKYSDAEFRASLDHALATGVKRVTRLVNQMRFLAREGFIEQESFPVGKLIEDAYQEARKHQPAEAAQLHYATDGKALRITGDRVALKHALSEIMLNALQANPKTPTVDVHLQTGPGRGGGQDLQIEVQDSGSGFTAEAAKRVPSAFFTTRNVGLGLGLTVSRKIIETHHGKLEIVPPQSGHSGVVRVSLPMEPDISTAA
jgi:signal transduction histidine kinase/GAF domain-containing protein/ActR/RegA family two-component response regulator